MVAPMEKKKRAKGRWRIWLIGMVVVLLALVLWIDANLRPIVVSMAEAQCRALAVNVLNKAISDAMGGEVVYDDLMQVSMDGQGHVSMLQANTSCMNRLAGDIVSRAQEGLKNLGVARINIPLGSVLGSKVLAGEGPRIPIKVYPVGSVTTNFQSEFEQSGINQTRHKVFLKTTTSIQIVIPTETRVVQVSENVLVAESIIVGQVPQSFFGTGSNDELLNLAP